MAGGHPLICSTAHVVTVAFGAAAVTVTPRVVSMVVELVAAASVVVVLIVRCMVFSTVAGNNENASGASQAFAERLSEIFTCDSDRLRARVCWCCQLHACASSFQVCLAKTFKIGRGDYRPWS